jgi:hypothetical protein
MSHELNKEQRTGLEDRLVMLRKLLALDTVEKHETRFDNEIALVSSKADIDAVDAVVQEHLGEPVKTASGKLPSDFAHAELLDAMGGVRGGQTLYLQDVGNGLVLYVAFWPWGSGARITIKVGVYES